MTKTLIKEVPVAPDVPTYLLSCSAAPDIPGDTARMPEINLFIVDQRAAYMDCKKKLELTRDVLESFNSSIKERAAEARAAETE